MTSVEDAMKLLMLGDRNRCFAFTKLVHTILSLKATFTKLLFNPLEYKKTMLMLCMRSAECTFVSKSYHCDSHGGEEGEVPNSRAEGWIGGEAANLFLLLGE